MTLPQPIFTEEQLRLQGHDDDNIARIREAGLVFPEPEPAHPPAPDPKAEPAPDAPPAPPVKQPWRPTTLGHLEWVIGELKAIKAQRAERLAAYQAYDKRLAREEKLFEFYVTQCDDLVREHLPKAANGVPLKKSLVVPTGIVTLRKVPADIKAEDQPGLLTHIVKEGITALIPYVRATLTRTFSGSEAASLLSRGAPDVTGDIEWGEIKKLLKSERPPVDPDGLPGIYRQPESEKIEIK